MRTRQVGEGERRRFDAFVAEHPTGGVLQSWAWGDIRKRQGWDAVRLAVEDQGGGVRGAASVLVRELPLGGSILYLPRGPVLDYTDAPALDAMASALRRLAEKRHGILVKVDPYVTPPDPRVRGALLRLGFRVGHRRGRFDGLQPRFCCIVDLAGGADAILARLHSKTRYNIRLAARRGVTVERCGRDKLPLFYRLLMETCERDGFRERAYRYFEQVWDGLAPGGHIHLFVASAQGRDLAAAVVITFGRKAVYLYGASSGELRQFMAPYAVQWSAIRFCMEQGCTTYDMTGVPKRLEPGEHGYGLWRFKRGFCGNQPAEFLGEYDMPVNPLLWRLWTLAEPAYWGSRVRLEVLRRRLRSA
jgi:peptidoglycan pentaglycine glycine transferase (the first glycine)